MTHSRAAIQLHILVEQFPSSWEFAYNNQSLD